MTEMSNIGLIFIFQDKTVFFFSMFLLKAGVLPGWRNLANAISFIYPDIDLSPEILSSLCDAFHVSLEHLNS